VADITGHNKPQMNAMHVSCYNNSCIEEGYTYDVVY
ncbi:hypothetical protein M089_2839, partial [Bacteroides ovatus str. 3725 D9 iii]